MILSTEKYKVFLSAKIDGCKNLEVNLVGKVAGIANGLFKLFITFLEKRHLLFEYKNKKSMFFS